jgi:hypothetical protein
MTVRRRVLKPAWLLGYISLGGFVFNRFRAFFRARFYFSNIRRTGCFCGTGAAGDMPDILFRLKYATICFSSAYVVFWGFSTGMTTTWSAVWQP